MSKKLDDLIERLPWRLYVIVRTIQYWPYRFRRICLYCVDCEQGFGDGETNYEAEWYCDFLDKYVDCQDTCRAFKRGKHVKEKS